MVEVADVRSVLNNIDVELVSDAVIFDKIRDAQSELEYLSNSNVPTQLVELAIKYLAAYKSYLAYLVVMERGMGTPPTPQMRTTLEDLKSEFERVMKMIEREYAAQSGVIPVSTTNSLSDDV